MLEHIYDATTIQGRPLTFTPKRPKKRNKDVLRSGGPPNLVQALYRRTALIYGLATLGRDCRSSSALDGPRVIERERWISQRGLLVCWDTQKRSLRPDMAPLGRIRVDPDGLGLQRWRYRSSKSSISARLVVFSQVDEKRCKLL
jgi:hypothetical protein